MFLIVGILDCFNNTQQTLESSPHFQQTENGVKIN